MSYFTLPLVIILGFVSYRLARLVAHDAIFEPFRNWVYAAQSRYGRAGRWLNTLTTCPFCLSVWFTFAAVAWTTWLILPTWPGIGEFLLAIPAVAGVAAILSATDLALTQYVELVEDYTDPEPPDPLPYPLPPPEVADQ